MSQPGFILFYFIKGRCRAVKHCFYCSLVVLCGGTWEGKAGPACNNGPVSPLWPPASQNHIPSRGEQAQLLFHINVAPGEAKQSPAV